MASNNLEFNKNEDALKLVMSDLKRLSEQIKQGGGKKSIEKHKAKGKMTARERIDMLLDKGKPV
ncbi:MAG: acyl-CoA carboxylase subunit beta, partial [Bacteroidota bacterium]